MSEAVENNTLTTIMPEDRLKLLADTLIANIVNSDDESRKKRTYLFSQFKPRIFRDENFVIYYVLYFFKDKGISPDEQFLTLHLMRNTKLYSEHLDYINLSAFSTDSEEDEYTNYTSGVIAHFTRIKNDTTLTQPFEQFKNTAELYAQEYKAFEMNMAYSQAKQILYDEVQLGRKKYQGYDDSIAYVKGRMANVDSLLDHTTGAGFIDSRAEALNDTELSEPEKLADFDLLDELNEHLGGLYTSMFYNVMAPTKGGKSKFTTRQIHSIILNGHNVSVWAHEGGYVAWWAQLRAIHFEYMYIRNKTSDMRVAPVSQQDILLNNFPSEQIKNLEAQSRIDLFTNPSYGTISMIDRPFKVETFIDEIETSVQTNDSKAVLIDYLQLIGWESRNLSKPQAIGQAYQQLLAYCKKRNILAISPAQFTQDFMSEMAKAKEGSQHEVRTGGGESSEIIRTPDINIALYATTEDLIRKEMTLMSVPSRLSRPFPDTRIYADLCTCVFSSIHTDKQE